MKRMMVVLAVLAFAVPASAQEIVDSIVIEVFGDPVTLEVDAPAIAYVGDTVTIGFQVVDSAGNPTRALVQWNFSPLDAGEFVEQTDTAIVIIPRKTGLLTLTVVVQRVDSMRLGLIFGPGNEVPEGTFLYPVEDFTLTVGGTAQMCPYLFNDNKIVATSRACIEAGRPTPSPEIDVSFRMAALGFRPNAPFHYIGRMIR